MIKYISKWYQNIIKTPRPDVEDASQRLREAIDKLNIVVAHLEKIDGVYGQLEINGCYGTTTVSFGARTKFKMSVDYIVENHRREF